MAIRKPAVAGSFYPSDAEELYEMLEEFEKSINIGELKEKLKDIESIKALIVPHAGYIYSGIVASYGFKALKLINGNVKDVALLGPSHYYGFYGYLQPYALTEWETPLGIVKVKKLKNVAEQDEPFIPEHSLEVEVTFLQYYFLDITISPVIFGAPSLEYELIINKTPLIISSDLSHYYDYETAKNLDQKTLKYIEELDIEGFYKYGEACGKSPILYGMQLAKKHNWKAKVLKYLNSGDTAGPKNNVVGYGAVIFYE